MTTLEILKSARPENLLFVEEEIKAGGFGMMLAESLRALGVLDIVKYDILAAKDAFITRKTGWSYLKASGLDAEAIAERIKKFD